MTNALELLKSDHEKVKGLFEKFEKSKDRKEKKRIVEDAVTELGIHSALEEEIFYPAIREEIEDGESLMNEADEEHHLMKVLVAELEDMTGNESHFDAKFHVLAESVRHHIKEEEGEIFPKVKETDLDLRALAEQLFGRKQELQEEGLPTTAEEVMVEKSGGQGDSPAAASEQKIEGFPEFPEKR